MVMSAVQDEIIGPDMIPVLWPFADTGTVIEPQSSLFGLFCGDFQPLSSPDTLDTFVIHLPTVISQQCSDSSVAISTVLESKARNSFSQECFIFSRLWLMALNRTMLTENFTCPALRNP